MSHRFEKQEPLVVHPEPASDPSSMQRIVGYVQTLIPQSYSNQSEELKQKILWAKFHQLDCPLKSCSGSHFNDDLKPASPPLVLILGYPSGYSVWSISGGEGGEGKEVLAQQTGGPVRVATLLKTPEEGLSDDYAAQRPLLAVVSKPFDRLVPVSLRDGKDLKQTISFGRKKNEQGTIVDIVSSSRYIVVVLTSRITLLDAGNLTSYLFYIKNNHTHLEYPWNPVAIGSRWLAYSDNKLHTHHLSRGGVYVTEEGSYTAKVLDAVEGFRRYASDVYSKYWTGEQQQQQRGGDSKGGSGLAEQHPATPPQEPGCIVTVLDVQRVIEKMQQTEGALPKVDLKSLDRGSGVIAHFLAYQRQDQRLAALSFDPSGMLLLTACTEGRTFNLFRILPHPSLSSETCVQHLHVLRRGETTSIVQDIAFSCDSRWAAISTLRGTTHVFPITPYGGPVTKRTHLFSRVVNRCSKFHITAGLTDSKRQLSSLTPGAELQPYTADVEFSLHHLGNPHVVMEKPYEIQPLLQIKQPPMSVVEDLQGTSPKLKKAPPRTPTTSTDCLPGHMGVVVSAVFAQTRGSWAERPPVRMKQGATEPQLNLAVDSLFVVGGNAVATEHVLVPRVSRDAKGKDSRDWKNSPDDAPVELDGTPRVSWNLLRASDSRMTSIATEGTNPLVTEYERCRAAQKEPRPPSSASLDQWLANVEILTHEEPPRRLWMGPQFSFKTYDSVQTTSTVTLLSGSGQPSQRAEGGGASVEGSVTSAVLDLSGEHTHSALLLDLCHSDLKSIKSKAMTIPQRPEEEEVNFVDTGPASLGPDFIECFGSWKDHMPVVKNGYSPSGITKELEDAMHESPATHRYPTIPIRSTGTTQDLSSPEDEFQDTLPELSQ